MKKLIILGIMILLITVSLSANEIEKEKDNVSDINFYLGQLYLQKITYNGIQGYFLPFNGYVNLTHILNDLVTYKFYYIEYQDRLNEIRRKERYNFGIRTALGINISLNVSLSVLVIGTGLMCYNIALLNNK